MRVFLVGKRGPITPWLEHAYHGFRAAECQAEIWSTTGNTPAERLRFKLAKWRGRDHWEALLSRQLVTALRRSRPQLILFIGAYLLPEVLYAAADEAAPGVPRVGWVGDRFERAKETLAQRLHRVFYTDSAFLSDAARFAFPDNGDWLPLAVDERLFLPGPGQRRPDMVFVANRTPWREEVVRRLRRPIIVYGRGWRVLRGSLHQVHPRRLPMHRLPDLYARARAVLNVRNEANVLGGLNQRCFEPLACGTPVLNDAQSDLARCFVPGEEILVWRDFEELNALHQRVGQDPHFAARIGHAGRRRVLAEHTYRHRIQAILAALDLKA
jgi:spore maturation protein CgeB